MLAEGPDSENTRPTLKPPSVHNHQSCDASAAMGSGSEAAAAQNRRTSTASPPRRAEAQAARTGLGESAEREDAVRVVTHQPPGPPGAAGLGRRRGHARATALRMMASRTSSTKQRSCVVPRVAPDCHPARTRRPVRWCSPPYDFSNLYSIFNNRFSTKNG